MEARIVRTRLANVGFTLLRLALCSFLGTEHDLGRRDPTGHPSFQNKQNNLPTAELTIQYKLGCVWVYGTSAHSPQGFEIFPLQGCWVSLADALAFCCVGDFCCCCYCFYFSSPTVVKRTSSVLLSLLSYLKPCDFLIIRDIWGNWKDGRKMVSPKGEAESYLSTQLGIDWLTALGQERQQGFWGLELDSSNSGEESTVGW